MEKKYITYKNILEEISNNLKNLKTILTQDNDDKDNALDEMDVSTIISSYQYKKEISNLLNSILKLAIEDKEINESTLKMFGYSLYRIFGYQVRITPEEQLMELSNIKEQLSQLIWDFADEEKCQNLETAYNNINSVLKNKDVMM